MSLLLFLANPVIPDPSSWKLSEVADVWGVSNARIASLAPPNRVFPRRRHCSMEMMVPDGTRGLSVLKETIPEAVCSDSKLGLDSNEPSEPFANHLVLYNLFDALEMRP